MSRVSPSLLIDSFVLQQKIASYFEPGVVLFCFLHPKDSEPVQGRWRCVIHAGLVQGPGTYTYSLVEEVWFVQVQLASKTIAFVSCHDSGPLSSKWDMSNH